MVFFFFFLSVSLWLCPFLFLMCLGSWSVTSMVIYSLFSLLASPVIFLGSFLPQSIVQGAWGWPCDPGFWENKQCTALGECFLSLSFSFLIWKDHTTTPALGAAGPFSSQWSSWAPTHTLVKGRRAPIPGEGPDLVLSLHCRIHRMNNCLAD